jgi:hypothetical protein
MEKVVLSGEQSATNEQYWRLAWSVGYQFAGGMVAAAGDLGPIEPRYRCKKQKEHITVTERET